MAPYKSEKIIKSNSTSSENFDKFRNLILPRSGSAAHP